mgnify:CR=1 FL=1
MKVTIVIPNYNGKHFMEPCLASLASQTYRDFKVLVVDNASSDGSVPYMKEHYPDIELIELDKNYGFSKAVNVGILHAKTPYVILLNNDTTVDSRYVEEMLKAIEVSPDIFSVSSKMIQMYHPELIDSAGDIYTIFGWGICRGTGRPAAEYTTPCEVFSACAGAAIYRRSVFEKIGYFDENHFAYLEDIDIGYRAKIYGYKNTFCPTALVYHVGSGTSGSKHNAFKVRLAARNNIYVAYKNMPILQLAVNFLPLFIGCIIKYIFFIRKGFGKEYKAGLMEGLKTRKAQKKVPFRLRHLTHYIGIEAELIFHTLSCAKSSLSHRISKK